MTQLSLQRTPGPLTSGLIAGAEIADSIQNYIPVKAARHMICEIDMKGVMTDYLEEDSVSVN